MTVRPSVVCACAVALFASAAAAADKPPAFEDAVRFTLAGLCSEAGVRADLKVTDKQAADLAAALADAEAKYAAGVKAATAKPAEEAAAATKALVEETGRTASAAAVSVLTAEQAKRLAQIHLRGRGPAAFDDPDVLKALAATDEQTKKWAALKDAFEVKLRKLRREAGGVRTGRTIPDTDLLRAGEESLDGKTVVMLKAEYALAAKNVLTGGQLDKWYDLLGDPYPNPVAAPKK